MTTQPGVNPSDLNPYRLPDDDGPGSPFCPWRVPSHEQYYVDIDGTEAAYRKFKDEIGEARGLLTKGRLVVTSGPKGCGKTSLINRCAAWLSNELNAAELNGVILDVTDACGAHQPKAKRMELTRNALLRKLKREMAPPDEALFSIADQDKRPVESTYPDLSSALDEKVVLLVLLPPVDLVDELVDYASLTHERIVFFSEIASTEKMRSRLAELDRPGRPAIDLAVNLLRASDFWNFAHMRQRRLSSVALPYPVTKTTMESLPIDIEGAWPVRRLHLLLAGAYDLMLKEAPPDAELTAENIWKFGFQMLMREEVRSHGE